MSAPTVLAWVGSAFQLAGVAVYVGVAFVSAKRERLRGELHRIELQKISDQRARAMEYLLTAQIKLLDVKTDIIAQYVGLKFTKEGSVSLVDATQAKPESIQ